MVVPSISTIGAFVWMERFSMEARIEMDAQEEACAEELARRTTGREIRCLLVRSGGRGKGWEEWLSTWLFVGRIRGWVVEDLWRRD
jgi:hypothetical protein